ncbi:MAG: hypothetical protein IPL46_20540 [Saprospiraceae bacterium]|nr:hypothetical protein [Saprospiraceae bacterium]
MIKFFFTVVAIYLTLMLIPHEPIISLILKPFIVGTLILWVLQASFVDPQSKRLLALALSFSLAGDIFLMIPEIRLVYFKRG